MPRPSGLLRALVWLCALGATAAANATLLLDAQGGAFSCTDRASCSDHGHCIDEACVCDEGWSGATCATAAPTPPPTPPSDGHDKARESLLFLLLVAVPFLGRALESKATKMLQEKCCKRVFGGDVLTEAMMGSAKGGDADELNAYDITGTCSMSWDAALAALGWSQSMGRAVGALRLVFWHWLQPGMYALSLYAYWDEIDATQQKLGLVVAAREALYPLLTLVALWARPIFLLANLSSPENRVKSFLWYVAMPEKYVLACALDDGWLFYFLLIFLPAADLCGTAALIVGAVKGTLPPALAVGYSVATLGWVSFAAAIALDTCGY